MIDRPTALATVRSFVAEKLSARRELRVAESRTIEHPVGWVFFVESGRYLEAGRLEDRLIGMPPILVDRRDGRVQPLPTGQPVSNSLEEYARWRATTDSPSA